jgi:glycosyltransferase involved in cell wall biosynthesis
MVVDPQPHRTASHGAPNAARRIRVLWLIKGLGPGGAEHLLVASARTRDRDEFDIAAAYLLPWKDALVERLEALDVPVRCLGVRDERDVRWVITLRRQLQRDPVDVVHVHSPYAAAMVRLAVRTLPRSRRPAVVSTEHNAWSTFRGPTRWANAATARLDAATIAVSQETRDSMSAHQRARCEVLAHGVDVADIRARSAHRAEIRAELGVDDATVLVGTVANYHPKKDWPNLLRTARLVADRGLPVRFCSVGQGPLQSEVEALHAELHLDGTVILTGFRPDAVELMAACDVFAMSSLWEGLPVAVMEALALGLPVVATAVGGLAETFTDGVDALLVPSGDSVALADAIERVACDPTLRSMLADAARARADEFDAARAQLRIEEIYRTVAPNRSER